MPYGTRNNGLIRTFTPDDTEDTFYESAYGNLSFQELFDKAREKWPEITLDQLTLTAEHIQTDCLTHDLHDPSDYTTYIVAKARPEYFEARRQAVATTPLEPIATE